jgi:hypothetical protein
MSTLYNKVKNLESIIWALTKKLQYQRAQRQEWDYYLHKTLRR